MFINKQWDSKSQKLLATYADITVTGTGWPEVQQHT